jgi:hypothetical protein
VSRSQSKAEYGRYAHLFVGGVDSRVGGSLPAWFQFGDGAPVNSVTPVQQGAVYQDLTHGTIYVAIGPTDADWIGFGSPGAEGFGDAAGVFVGGSAGRSLYVLGGNPNTPFDGTMFFSPAYEQWNGAGNGLSWTGNGVAGDGTLKVRTGAAGEFTGTLQDAEGNMEVPGYLRYKLPITLMIGSFVVPAGAPGIIALAPAVGAGAYTLADPSEVQAGTELIITALTAFAHTVSNAAGSGFNGAGAGSAVATFGGARGDTMVVVAIASCWHVVSLRNVTLGA